MWFKSDIQDILSSSALGLMTKASKGTLHNRLNIPYILARVRSTLTYHYALGQALPDAADPVLSYNEECDP